MPTKKQPATEVHQEPTKNDYRRTNLRALIDQWEGPLQLAKKLGYANASFIVQMAGPNPSRQVSERFAQMVEDKLNLGRGYMDKKPGAVQTVLLNTDLLNDCVRVVTQECEDAGVRFAPAKFADLVTLVYTDAVGNSGTIDTARMKMYIKFAK
jgi:hypothetical protein